MADPRRFPRLEIPFAIVGTAAGFLSAGLLANPMINQLPRDRQPVAVVAATVAAALTGYAIRRLCVRKKLTYELEEPDPLERSPYDRAAIHGALMILAGAVVGAFVGATFDYVDCVDFGVLSGATCALVFVPVGLAVIGAARRAQRARLGTLVAGSDRRAVWSILATALAVTTFEALPDSRPYGAWSIAIACGVVVLVVWVRDRAAARCVEIAVSDLSTASDAHVEAPLAIDLGLGEQVAAHVATSKNAYRDRDRVIDLVRGDPSVVRAAMSRARRRADASAAIVAFVLAAHFAVALRP